MLNERRVVVQYQEGDREAHCRAEQKPLGSVERKHGDEVQDSFVREGIDQRGQ